jgi:hypothetical protein
MTKATQRKATANHRKRIRAKGLVRVEVQVPQSDVPLVRELAQHLRADSKIEELRNILKAALGGQKPKTVLDMFASDLPDEYFEGVFDHERTISHREIDL